MKHLPDYEQGKLTQSIKKTKIGKTLEKRDYLVPNSNDAYITKQYNNTRQSCVVIYLDKLPKETKLELKRGNWT